MSMHIFEDSGRDGTYDEIGGELPALVGRQELYTAIEVFRITRPSDDPLAKNHIDFQILKSLQDCGKFSLGGALRNLLRGKCTHCLRAPQ